MSSIRRIPIAVITNPDQPPPFIGKLLDTGVISSVPGDHLLEDAERWCRAHSISVRRERMFFAGATIAERLVLTQREEPWPSFVTGNFHVELVLETEGSDPPHHNGDLPATARAPDPERTHAATDPADLPAVINSTIAATPRRKG